MHTPKILIVEDSVILSISLADNLRTLGYEVVGNVTSGEEALHLLKDAPTPDLILMDISLDGQIDGIETRKKLLEAGNDLPTIFITGNPDETTRQRADRTNPLGFILKPWKQLQLEVTLRLAIGKIMAERQLQGQLAAPSHEAVNGAAPADLQQKLAPYLPPQILHPLLASQPLPTEAKRMRVSVLVCDIVGFSEITERLEASQIMELLNEYYAVMGEVVLQNGGLLDRLGGDIITAFFGAPSSKGAQEDALACVSAALQMRERLRDLQHSWEKYGIARRVEMRIGINTGHCLVGTLGLENHEHYTLLGYQLRIARQLGKSGTGDQILVSQYTHELIRHAIACARQAEISVEGFSEPISVFQVVDRYENLKLDVHKHQFLLKLDEFLENNAGATFTGQELEMVVQKLTQKLSSSA